MVSSARCPAHRPSRKWRIDRSPHRPSRSARSRAKTRRWSRPTECVREASAPLRLSLRRQHRSLRHLGPRCTVEVMIAQPPRVLPRILAAVRVHNTEVRTYALLDGYPLRMSKKFQTIVFRDTTGQPRSRTARTSRPRLYGLKSTESERIQHQMQQLEAQLRARRAAQSSTIVMIERDPCGMPCGDAYDASGSKSSEDTGFDLLSTPRDEFGMRIVLNPTAAAAARVIQKGWREHLQRRSLPGSGHPTHLPARLPGLIVVAYRSGCLTHIPYRPA